MRITWLGHACFLLEEDGYRIVTDPYTGVEGYPPLEAEAHAVYCSHHHFDHDAVDCVRLLPAQESPFHVREIQAFHDDQKGALRGPNTIRVFTAGGVSVGGVYTVDAQGAKAACDAIGPKWIVPMHYHHAPYGLPDIAGVEDFLALWPAEQVHSLPGAGLDTETAPEGVLLPKF